MPPVLLLPSALERLAGSRPSPPALADLLPWSHLVGEGQLLLKDGSLLRTFRLIGPDAASMGSPERAQLAEQVHAALMPLSDDWLFHVDAVRRPASGYAPAGHFPDPISSAIDEERRRAYDAAGRLYQNETYLSATFRPPRAAQQRLMRALVSSPDPERSDVWSELLRTFNAATEDLASRLSASVEVQPLQTAELLRYLHFCLTGRDTPILAPIDHAAVDCYLADGELVTGFRPRVGAVNFRLVAVHAWPRSTSPGLLDALERLAAPLRVCHRFLPLGSAAADKVIAGRLGLWFNTRRSARALLRDAVRRDQVPNAREAEEDRLFFNAHASEMAADAAAARADNAAGSVHFGFYSATLVLADSDPAALDETARQVVKTLTDAGFPARVEDVNALEAFFSTLPGDGTSNLRRVVLSSRNVTDLLPLTRVSTGSPDNPSPLMPPKSPALLWAVTAGGSEPFRFNLHAGDVGHALILGPTGSGKSVLVALLALQFLRYQASRVIHFDVGGSGYLPCLAAGGLHYELASSSRPVDLQPLRRIDDPEELVWASDWLELLFALQGLPLDADRRRTLQRALRAARRQARPGRALADGLGHPPGRLGPVASARPLHPDRSRTPRSWAPTERISPRPATPSSSCRRSCRSAIPRSCPP